MAHIATPLTIVSTTTASSVNGTFTSSIPTGHTLVGAINTTVTGASPTVTVTDSKGNSYTTAVVVTNGTTDTLAVFSTTVTTALTTSDTMTISFNDGTHIRFAVSVEEFDDVISPGLDKTASTTGASTAFASGTTAATTYANELVIGAFGFSSPSGKVITAGSGFSGSTIQGTAAGSSDRGVYVEWKYVNSIGTQAPTATANASATWAGAAATFRSQTIANQVPTANAGIDQTVAANQVVTLDGTGSGDSDGTIASYSWTQLSGTAVTLSSASATKPTFIAPLASSASTLVFGLQVTDNSGATSTSDSVTINVNARVGHIASPIATISTTLSSSNSFSFAGAIPAGHAIVGAIESNFFTSTPAVTVTDSKGNSYVTDVSVADAATNTLTIFSCRLTTSVTTSDTLTINFGDGSHNRWAVLVEQYDDLITGLHDKTASSTGVGTSFSGGTTIATAQANELVFGAFGLSGPSGKVITAGSGFSNSAMQATAVGTSDRAVITEWKYVNSTGAQGATASVNNASTWVGSVATYQSMTIPNQVPTANAGPDQSVAAQQLVTLDGSVSNDPDGSISLYSWTQLSGRPVTLSSVSDVRPTFYAPFVTIQNTMVFGLVVIDNAGEESIQDTVTITVNAAVGHVSTPIGSAKSISSVISTTFPVSQAAVAGHVLIGAIVCDANTVIPNITVSDSKGNSYHVDAQGYISGTCSVAIFSSRLSTSLTTSDTLTIAADNKPSRWAVSVEAFDNLVGPTVTIDVSSASSGRGTSLTTGATNTTNGQNELLFAAFGYAATIAQTFTGANGFTVGTQQATSAGSSDRGLSTEWKTINAASPQTATGTITTTANYSAAIASYASYSITGNTQPTANAGIDQAVANSTTVTLNGSASTDVDGTIASYTWRRISGTAVSLSSTSVAQPSFTAPATNGILVFGLVVTDNFGSQSAEDTVTIFVGSQIGYLGQAVTGTKVVGGTSATFSFSKSVVTGHTLLIAAAVETSQGGIANMTATDTKGNTYTLDSSAINGVTIADAILSCYVTNALTTSDTITITTTGITHNRWMIAGSEFDNVLQNGKDVTASNSARTTTLSSGTTAVSQNHYELAFATFGFSRGNAQTMVPGGGYVLANQVNTSAGSSERAVVSMYRFFSTSTAYQATATIGAIATWSGSIVTYQATSLGNAVPIASAGSTQTVTPFSTVTLDGSASQDSDGIITNYVWSQTAGPSVSLSSTTVSNPTFTAPGIDGGTSLTFSLVVTDNGGATSALSSVTINVSTALTFVAQGTWKATEAYRSITGSWR
jgi:hypothetical protein